MVQWFQRALPSLKLSLPASSNRASVVKRITGHSEQALPILPIHEFSYTARRKPESWSGRKQSKQERRSKRDILKELFPYGASVPTGINASCYRPTKGAAGPPRQLRWFQDGESFSSNYVPKPVPLANGRSENKEKGHSIPMCIKVLLFVVEEVFCFVFAYQATL